MRFISGRPSLGVEYHLGVDGLGALMLLLSAIVTLMSVDASHRVHHMPGLFYGLILILESGLFGSFTALNFFHWFLFWELSLIPAFFLIKLWGGPTPRPRGHAILCLHNGRLGGVAALISGALSFHWNEILAGHDGLWRSHRHGRIRRAGANGHGALGRGNAVARHRRARRLRSQSADRALPHVAAGRIC